MKWRLLGKSPARAHLTIGTALGRLDGAQVPLKAALAFLALALPTAAAAVSIGGVQALPNPFTPNGDGRTDAVTLTFVPSDTESTVVARVTVSDVATSAPVDTLLDDAVVPVDVPVETLWSPGTIADGRYRFDIRVVEGADTANVSVEVTADTAAPDVALGSVVPNPFDPVSAEHDSLLVPFTVVTDSLTPTTTTVSIRQNGAIVVTLGTFAGGGTDSLRWGGNRAGSTSPVSGRYQAVAVAADLAGNADSTTVSFFQDVEKPVFRFPAGHSDTTMTTSFPLTLSGSVEDATRVDAVSVSFDTTTFVPVDSMSAPSDSVYWEVVVTDPSPVRGRRDVTIRAWDVFGDVAAHRTDRVQTVAYDVAFPVKVGTTVVLNENATVLRGELLQIRTFWDRDDLEMSADMSALDSEFDSTMVFRGFTSEGGGAYLYEYEVAPTNNKPSGSKLVTIRATTPFIATTEVVRVTLREGRADPEQLLFIDKNWFDPLARETVRISSEFATTPISVDIWNLAGHRVRTLQGSGVVVWDGTSDEGREVASGVYFLRLRTDDGEEKRRVAVVRGGRR
jgi:hypothetical protein